MQPQAGLGWESSVGQMVINIHLHAVSRAVSSKRQDESADSCSKKVRDDFLLYVCKDVDPAVAGQVLNSAQIEAYRLIKQTYSVYVEASPQRRKWHISELLLFHIVHPKLNFVAAYYTPATLNRLATIDNIPLLASIIVPPNIYCPARATKHLKGKSGELEPSPSKSPSGNVQHSYSYPSPARRSSLPMSIVNQSMVSRGQIQVSGSSSRARYPGVGAPGMEVTLLSPGTIHPPSSTSTAHPATNISRPSTAIGPNAHLNPSTATATAALTQDYRLATVHPNARRRSSISQPCPYATAATTTTSTSTSSVFPNSSSSSLTSIPLAPPPSMVPLFLLEQSQSRTVHRSPIDDSVLKRLPPSTN
jgi:hypothetical protein